MRTALTLLLFASTLVAVVARPRGIAAGWFTCAAAAIALAAGLVQPAEVWALIGVAREALLFLLALLLLSALLEASGFFAWAAVLAARSARSGAGLLRNVLLLGALITTVLSLDTTAVILTPLVVAAVQRLEVPARPYILVCVFVSNVASLLLPVSNLTNLLLAAHVPATRFAAAMGLPQLATLAVLWAGLRLACRRELRPSLDTRRLPPASTLIVDRPFFRAACGVLVLLVLGYFLGPAVGVPVWMTTFAGVLALAAVGLARGRVGRSGLQHLSLGVFPFVVGLFALVQAVENLGLDRPLVAWLGAPRPAWAGLAAMTAVASVASSALNNLPATLLVRSMLGALHAPDAWMQAALLGTNIGSCLTPHGTLATLLVLSAAARRGVDVPPMAVVKVALWLVPAMLVAGVAALLVSR
ncbi:MAG TPA: ArsB/NhaD family transporter [Myxococcaceae bacterium]|nr:ArsB/NhaD family transporter [Myxococcaceae bacterium]